MSGGSDGKRDCLLERLEMNNSKGHITDLCNPLGAHVNWTNQSIFTDLSNKVLQTVFLLNG